MKLVQIVATVE